MGGKGFGGGVFGAARIEKTMVIGGHVWDTRGKRCLRGAE